MGVYTCLHPCQDLESHLVYTFWVSGHIVLCLVGRDNNKLSPLTSLQYEKKKIGKVNLNERTYFSFNVVLAYRDEFQGRESVVLSAIKSAVPGSRPVSKLHVLS